MNKDLELFCEKFSSVENALDMRNLIRWNGRNLKNRENLAEHTHLVLVCAVDFYDSMPDCIKSNINFESLIKNCLYHDSLELLRGDILSVTKDAIPGLRSLTDLEEQEFLDTIVGETSTLVKKITKLADLKACYKFIENEISFPSNDFALKVYTDCKKKFDLEYIEFQKQYLGYCDETTNESYYSKAYENDAGSDIVLNETCVFLPHSTTVKEINLNFTPDKNSMGILCSRTSAAKKGLIVAMSPIDPGYTGKITAIVHNNSNDIITYEKGESFCQLLVVPFINQNNVEVRIKGNRADGKLGSSGKC